MVGSRFQRTFSLEFGDQLFEPLLGAVFQIIQQQTVFFALFRRQVAHAGKHVCNQTLAPYVFQAKLFELLLVFNPEARDFLFQGFDFIVHEFGLK